MKTKILMAVLLASAALIAPVQGGHHGGGGGGGSAFAARSAPARSGGVSSYRAMGRFSGGPAFRSAPVRSFSGNPMIYSGQRFSSVGMRSSTVNNTIRGNNLGRFSNGRNQSLANLNRGTRGQFQNGQVRNGNRLRSDWRSHVFAQHSANWQRNWDRSRDHWWHGHRCHFFNGSWVIFDAGFDPWWPYWGYPYGYPYPYGYGYGYGYGYPDDYDSGYYGSSYQGEVYPSEPAYESGYDDQTYPDQGRYNDQSSEELVAAAQQQLSQQGYYRGRIDATMGPATRRALISYQRDHGLRVTGSLTSDTVAALRLRVASN